MNMANRVPICAEGEIARTMRAPAVAPAATIVPTAGYMTARIGAMSTIVNPTPSTSVFGPAKLCAMACLRS
jgi:hypothetical protein